MESVGDGKERKNSDSDKNQLDSIQPDENYQTPIRKNDEVGTDLRKQTSILRTPAAPGQNPSLKRVGFAEDTQEHRANLVKKQSSVNSKAVELNSVIEDADADESKRSQDNSNVENMF